jgi:hypothetical protein
MSIEGTKMKRIKINSELVALGCGILGVTAAVWAYWLILPGVAAILLAPSILFIAAAAESWGRDCALDPTHDPNC